MVKAKLAAVDPTPAPTAPEPATSNRPEPPRFTVETQPGGPTLLCRSKEQPVGDWIAGSVTTCGIGNLDAVTTLISKAVEASVMQPPTTETVNGVVALMHAIAPKDAVEAMLAAQMVATHQGAMESLRRAMTSEQAFQVRQANLSQASKLSRTHVALLEALNRHRGKGQQKVTVEHVHVHQGGRAVVGAVAHSHPGGGGKP